MRLSSTNEAIAAVRKNARLCDALKSHIAEVRAHELEMLATGTNTIEEVKHMQGRIAAWAELVKVLET